MANQNAKIDYNYRKTLIAVTDDANQEIRRLVVDPITGRLKCTATISGSVVTTGELTWKHQTTTSLQLDGSSNIYINIGADNNNLVTITLPTNADSMAGKTFSVLAMGAGGWKIAQNAGQIIHFGNQATTAGASGYLASSHQYDFVKLICIVGDGATNAEWAVICSIGNIVVS